jgi:hypothetical protein
MCSRICAVGKIEKNEMGGACGAYGGGESCAQGPQLNLLNPPPEKNSWRNPPSKIIYGYAADICLFTAVGFLPGGSSLQTCA